MTWSDLYHSLAELIWPTTCLGCRRKGVWLCAACRATVAPADNELPDIFAAWSYEDTVAKRIIWRLKYNGQKDVGAALGQVLHHYLLEELGSRLVGVSQVIVLPIPLSARRQRERGYNQAELIARGLVAADPTTFVLNTAILTKIKETPPQVTATSRLAREKNVAGAFAASLPAALADQPMVVIDDVATTGATLYEAKRALRAAGAHQVILAAVAHG